MRIRFLLAFNGRVLALAGRLLALDDFLLALIRCLLALIICLLAFQDLLTTPSYHETKKHPHCINIYEM